MLVAGAFSSSLVACAEAIPAGAVVVVPLALVAVACFVASLVVAATFFAGPS